jgi:hypothetical protein
VNGVCGEGRDRVPAILCLRRLTAFDDRMIKIHLEARNVFPAREDTRPLQIGVTARRLGTAATGSSSVRQLPERSRRCRRYP